MTPKPSLLRSAALILAVSVLACGTTGSGAAQPAAGGDQSAFRAAPIEGSPEQAAVELGRGQRSYAAPVEGSPEQAALELGR